MSPSSAALDRPRRLAGDVVDAAIHAGDLVGDTAGDASQDLRRKVEPVGGHEVLGRDGAKDDDLVVRSPIALNADGLDRQQCGEGWQCIS